MNWAEYLKLDPKQYNCWTFVERVKFGKIDIWTPELEKLSKDKQARWGNYFNFDDIDNLAKLNNGIKVKFENIQEKDILVFGLTEKRPLHFGLYIGENQFIHHRRIPKIDLLDDYWRAKLKFIYRETYDNA